MVGVDVGVWWGVDVCVCGGGRCVCVVGVDVCVCGGGRCVCVWWGVDVCVCGGG